MRLLKLLNFTFLLSMSIAAGQYIQIHPNNSITDLSQIEKIVFDANTMTFTGTSENFILGDIDKITFEDSPVNISVMPHNISNMKQNQNFKVIISGGNLTANILSPIKEVSIKMYNISGKLLTNENIKPDCNRVLLTRTKTLGSGTYLIRFTHSNYSETHKINIVR